MSFPKSPANNATTVINGVTYTYNSTLNSWTKVPIGLLSVVEDPASATVRYPAFVANTSGSIVNVNTDSAELTYVPSTGTLSATNLNIGSTNVLDYVIAYNLAFG
jgi:hypothetical protein